MYIEKLASQIINDVVSGLRGYHSNLALNIENEFNNKLRQRSAELAALKDQVHYLKKLRCYDFDCPKRIKNNTEE